MTMYHTYYDPDDHNEQEHSSTRVRGAVRRSGVFARAAARKEGQRHHERQKQCKCSFHLNDSL